MKLFATVLEKSCDAAVQAIGAIGDDHDGVEVRAEHFAGLDMAAIRAATDKPVILTFRNCGSRAGLEVLEPALAAGIDFVDVEWGEDLDREEVARWRERVVLSYHDYEGMRGVEAIFAEMTDLGCAHTKVAVTPAELRDNERLLALQRRTQPAGTQPGVTVVGLGERGLYSRILAPFRGAALSFAAAGPLAAPGQLTLENALAIYGPQRDGLRADKVFAIAGNPAGHSLSPSIHNRRFREKGVSAAYTIASVARFEEVAKAFQAGEPCGLGVTSPFKEEALEFARAAGATISGTALACGAVNTLLNHGGVIHADNTDVDGFRAILRQICGRDRKSVAILGAGGTARAALLAVRQEQMHATIFNRTAGKLEARPLEEFGRWDGEIVIDTTSADLDLPMGPGMTYVRAAYGTPSRLAKRAAVRGAQVFDGIDLLEAQAVRQHEIFMKVFDEL